MRRLVLIASLAVTVLVVALPPAVRAEERTVTSIAESPLSDVNLQKKHIPPVLIAAQAHPYAPITDCAKIAAAVRDLDAVLGRDLDTPAPSAKHNEGQELAMDAGQDTINSLIPGRFIIRRLTGAVDAQRKAVAAVLPGRSAAGSSRDSGPPRAARRPRLRAA